MASLPLLPGYTFRDITVKDYKLPHKLDTLNGFPVVRDTNYGIGRRLTDAASVRYAEGLDPVEYDISSIYGRVPCYVYRQFVPHYSLFAQKCLRFKAFFRQGVFNSPDEHYRVRHVDIMYYLEDDTFCVIEPVVKNAGFQQGKLVRRNRIPKNAKGDLFIWKDFNVGIDVCIYGVVYHIVDCDPFTREFLTSQGVDVGEKESLPADPYMEQRDAKCGTPTKITRVGDDKRRRFLEYDGMVLSFDATWNDDRYKVLYFLTDDTVAIREIHEPNDGKDPVAMLLKRMRVPKNWQNLPSWHPSICMEYGDPEVMEYCTPRDFRIGETILLFGRRFLLHDCDAFTRKYYSAMLGTPQPDAIPIPARVERPAPRYEVPPHIKFGSPEDTYASCLSFVPKPPKKNVTRQLVNFPKKLRYSARMDATHPEDEGRDFVMVYSLSDGTVQINEIEKRNSGRREGCFLSFRLIPKPCTGKDDPEYYTPRDFFIGARVNVFNHRFVITGADLFVYRYVEANHDKFCPEVRENLRNYFLQQGMLQDDVDVEARKIQKMEDEQKLFAERNVIAENVEDYVSASKCTDEKFDMIGHKELTTA
ncbi:PREDICTED: EF-hand domain-containing protein 1-like [Wasmannia auropunctata]|uniref:EF-hand domain-containing protein 1-like n=1 Tax=Wasmannia auropunctata TaxID=64793 RepID=UPI0005EE0974|nr:PREDICTED: EF-hand domain-containing protein 1-like [Wasmannia auropunctata]